MSLGTVDGQAGAQRLLSVGRWASGMCLEAVWDTSGAGSSDSPGSYQSARDWWARCPADRKHGDRNPPAGALLRFSNGSADGHICYSLGGAAAASTDKPSAGLTGVTSISAIEASWGGRHYEGWTDWLGGWDVVTAANSSTISNDITSKENLMGLRIISCPSWRAGKVQAIHNGQVSDLCDDSVAATLRPAGVDSHDYDTDAAFMTELQWVNHLGGLSVDAAKSAVEDLFKKAGIALPDSK